MAILKFMYFRLISDFQANMYRNLASLSTPSRDSAKSMPNLNGIPLVRGNYDLWTEMKVILLFEKRFEKKRLKFKNQI